jgi:small subunit ribosomal protein S1
MHWTRKVKHPSEVLNKGDEVEAIVLQIDIDAERLSLGLKQLSEDPWSSMADRYAVGALVNGKVTNVTDFGVFVELEEGVEGMVHVSQLSRERIENPRDVLQPGQLIEAEVLQVDTRERRIALSVKSMLDSKDKAEMREYMSTTTVETSSRTTLGDLINQELVRGKTGDGVEQAVGEEEQGDGEPGSNGE